MGPYINALLLRFDGDADGADVPTKGQVAVTWASTATLVMFLVRK